MYAELDLPTLMAGRASNDNPEPSRRRYPRRTTDQCVFRMGGKTYPVKDWSRCGVLLEADGRDFADMPTHGVLAFHIPGQVIEVPVEAEMVRASNKYAAFTFPCPAEDSDRLFDLVIESQFLEAMQNVQISE